MSSVRFKSGDLEFVAQEKPNYLKSLRNRGLSFRAPVYSAHELPRIYDYPRSATMPESNGLKILRYLITAEGEPRFALAGIPSRTSSPHQGMPREVGATCIFPCDIQINANDEAVHFNNKSSDYKPRKDDIQWGIMSLRLLSLVHPSFKIAAEITIEFLDYYGEEKGEISTSYLMTREAFNKLADEMIAHYRNNPHFQDSHGRFILEYDAEKITFFKSKYPAQTVPQSMSSSHFSRDLFARDETKEENNSRSKNLFGTYNVGNLSTMPILPVPSASPVPPSINHLFSSSSSITSLLLSANTNFTNTSNTLTSMSLQGPNSVASSASNVPQPTQPVLSFRHRTEPTSSSSSTFPGVYQALFASLSRSANTSSNSNSSSSSSTMQSDFPSLQFHSEASSVANNSSSSAPSKNGSSFLDKMLQSQAMTASPRKRKADDALPPSAANTPVTTPQTTPQNTPNNTPVSSPALYSRVTHEVDGQMIETNKRVASGLNKRR